MIHILRDQIIANAQELFTIKGYDKTSISDIIKATKCSKGGLYHYFESKMDIVTAIMETQFQEYTDSFNAIVDFTNKTALENINSIFSFLIRIDSENVGNPEFDMYFTLTNDDIFLSSLMKIYNDSLSKVFDTLIRMGVKNGEFKSTNPLLTSKLVIRESTAMAMILFEAIKLSAGIEELKEIINFTYGVINNALGIEEGLLLFRNELIDYLENHYDFILRQYTKGEQ